MALLDFEQVLISIVFARFFCSKALPWMPLVDYQLDGRLGMGNRNLHSLPMSRMSLYPRRSSARQPEACLPLTPPHL